MTFVNRNPSRQSWAPVGWHTHAYYLAEKGGYDDQVFASSQHVPIRPVRPLRRSRDAEGRLLLGDFDYLLVQHDDALRDVPTPPDASLQAQHSHWSLYRKSTGREIEPGTN